MVRACMHACVCVHVWMYVCIVYVHHFNHFLQWCHGTQYMRICWPVGQVKGPFSFGVSGEELPQSVAACSSSHKIIQRITQAMDDTSFKLPTVCLV